MSQRYETWLQLKAEHPKQYARDIAKLMHISEAELTHARVGHDARRLKSDAKALLKALQAVGETKCICRNEYAVHEQVGRFDNQQLDGHAGLILNPRALDLRLFFSQWVHAFYIRETTARGERQSIQFFDRHGDAVLKVYTTDKTDFAAWDQVVTEFTQTENPDLVITPVEAPTEATPVVDAAKFEAEWRALTDVHDFFILLKRYQLTRQQAFRLVSDDLACKVDNHALSDLLDLAKEDQNEIMIFVGNRGCVQIFTGEIHKLMPMENWINVFNPEFTLHLMSDKIAETWVTRKPTKDGHVTSLELYAADGTQIAQLYGQRTEGEPEQQQWRKQIDTLLSKGLTA
ncbi:ChuX/HutX family heme-like substrate-binding protein [Citrobacter sp. JGM124]|uniref:hemin-degrading factor n=1 Tax=Citrobacter sp. JGM124 TaxID=2799789 RepID=UPI001BAE23A1|nr:ChuX/HutX family heme-like substrate-binding protein [Citrobacter sp. JGM124]MBS0847498.1 hemin-degrading factor [Citrobacter sp. JGM124]